MAQNAHQFPNLLYSRKLCGTPLHTWLKNTTLGSQGSLWFWKAILGCYSTELFLSWRTWSAGIFLYKSMTCISCFSPKPFHEVCGCPHIYQQSFLKVWGKMFRDKFNSQPVSPGIHSVLLWNLRHWQCQTPKPAYISTHKRLEQRMIISCHFLSLNFHPPLTPILFLCSFLVFLIQLHKLLSWFIKLRSLHTIFIHLIVYESLWVSGHEWNRPGAAIKELITQY